MAGFITGAVVGAVGAVAYSVQTGRDLREEYARLRDEMRKNQELDGFARRMEQSLKDVQATVDQRLRAMEKSGSGEAAAGDADGGDPGAPAGEAAPA